MAEISILTSSTIILTTLLSLWLLSIALNNKKVVYGITIWMIIVGALGASGFYQKVGTVPPRFVLLLPPTILFVLLLFTNKKSKGFMDNLSLKWLTILHIVRIPVEIVFYYVFLAGLIPELMTFSGYNYDIISGLTAPILYYLVFVKKIVGRKGLLIWNFVCLGLLINILTIATLSAQTPFQQLAFEQPNIGVAYFPFVWIPAVIVPIVLFSHLVSIRQLISRKQNISNF
ncbi:hypothetical protein KIM67_11320 [Flagellimonas sp. 389]|uniref:hypothetical protein n=1 Tax=Flagellimonas sp. 389 TaxID=2835862 RepID=UPI001BD38FC5|nr:hypothetical protein [Flagellimonas sp. 389]MBS9463003.1 hypothetical protein [Flagellimonas sp. 389]